MNARVAESSGRPGDSSTSLTMPGAKPVPAEFSAARLSSPSRFVLQASHEDPSESQAHLRRNQNAPPVLCGAEVSC